MKRSTKKYPDMSRRHFEYLALCIQELDLSEKQRRKIAIHFAAKLQYTNPRFKLSAFVERATEKPKYV